VGDNSAILFWLDLFRDFAIVVSLLVWAASLAWLARDARERGVNRFAAIALGVLFPLVGAFLYTLLRPRARLSEVRERQLWLQLAEVAATGDQCPECRTAIERDYVACPSCATVLRRRCSGCGSAVDFAWSACAYCGEREDETGWVDREPARAASEVTELTPVRVRRKPRSKVTKATESAL
jgi:hypothetical protein